MNSLFIGNFKAAFAGKWIEFQDFREYSPEDDAKYIDWLTSSREGNIVMRRYREEKEWNILCVLDVTDSLFFEWGIKSNVMMAALELISQGTLASGEAFGWYIYSWNGWDYVRPRKTPHALHELAQYQKFSPRVHREVWEFDELYKRRWKKSIIFIMSDSLNISERSFSIAAVKHDIIYVHLSSQFENTLEWDWVYQLRGKDTKLTVDLRDSARKQKYQELRQKQLLDFWKTIRKLWGDIVFLTENTPIVTEFLKLMKRREK